MRPFPVTLKLLAGIACIATLSPLSAEESTSVPGITQPAQTKEQSLKSTAELIERITPGYSQQFQLEIIPAKDGQDVYEIDGDGKKVILRGNNAVSLASAYHWYLKYTCNAHLSWFGDQLNLPKTLPQPKEKTEKTIAGKHRVYMNYCTASYSASWWNWERWQREIDFMAMNGINMPLFVVGIEGVWYNTLLKCGFTDQEAREFLVGPTYFAWQWMQNIQSLGGPLPKSWIDKHIALGQQVMKRQLELGMTPIQPGFSGFVPRACTEKFPNAKIKKQPRWCGFEGAAQLDPLDPLFNKMGKAFMEEQKKLYGAHGFYAADPFHESAPPVNTPEYLNDVGTAIHKLMKDFDPKSTWVMQAWSLREKIIKAVPKENLLILDLNGSKGNGHHFWGYEHIVGNLHNFGGRINLHGDLDLIASNQYATVKGKAPNACGSGLFMEAIEQNPVYYDLTFEIPNHVGPVDLPQWLNKYATRRYGAESAAAQEAWKLLHKGPYRQGTNGTENSSIICARPAIHCKKSGPNSGMHIPYDPTELIRAQALLLKDADKLKNSVPYRFDTVDVQRQIQSNLGQAIHIKAAESFEKRDKEAFTLHSARFLEMLKDTDALLRTRPEFNFDRWVTDARSWGNTQEEKDFYERNATMLVTIWGIEKGMTPEIFDYSWREWSGLIDGFYLPRWKMFYDMLQGHLDAGTTYSEKDLPQVYGREAFRANDFYKQMALWEEQYVNTPGKARTPVTQGDDLQTAKRLFDKYEKLSAEYYPGKVEVKTPVKEKKYENLGEK